MASCCPKYVHIITFLLSDTEIDLRIPSQNATTYAHAFLFKQETLNVNIHSWLGQLEILLFYIVNSASKVISFAITEKDADKLHNISGIFKLKARIPGMVQIIRELEQQDSNRGSGKKERGNSE